MPCAVGVNKQLVQAKTLLRQMSQTVEDIEDAKTIERAKRANGGKPRMGQKMAVPYNEPEHQPRMTSEFDFDQAKQTHSFNRAYEKLANFLCN